VCILVVSAAVLASGCGSSSATTDAPQPNSPSLATRPLTAEIWKQSTDQEKYAPELLARLRAEDPSLKSPASWKKFHKEIVVPGFQRDVARPGGPSPAPPPE